STCAFDYPFRLIPSRSSRSRSAPREFRWTGRLARHPRCGDPLPGGRFSAFEVSCERAAEDPEVPPAARLFRSEVVSGGGGIRTHETPYDAQRLSRPPHSTALPPLQWGGGC